MNSRERILALTVVAVAILVGGGVLFKFLFLDALTALRVQTDDAEQDLDKKQAELTKESQDRKTILTGDPRLAQWQRLSLPEDNSQEKELKKGRPLEEIRKRHEENVAEQYERFLTELLTRSGFAPSTIKVTPTPADRKGAPKLSDKKTPAYTKLSFTVTGQAALDGVVRMVQDFYQKPLLHEVRSLTLAKGPSSKGDLDVNMTVEALMVTGAEKRDDLLPDKTVAAPHVLADPSRSYTDMLAKNIFTGVAVTGRLTEERSQVLGVVKLTALWNSGRRWEATYYDQGKGGDEKRLTERTINEFSVADKYDNVLVQGKVVRLDGDGAVFQSGDKYYRWTCGQYLSAALDEPLKDDEIKKLGLTATTAVTGN
ncbi:MAG TPA: hypothetical protein DDY78_12540 [Planctomycetales bacterium]|jgi:hypothetical protein|nr:hypothetical protein [Planctomycetales bacterium]